MNIITISNLTTKEFFFTTDHCQDHGLGPEWVPCSYRLPMTVTPREGIEDGIVDTPRKLVKVFYDDHIKVLNPDPEYMIDHFTDI